MFQKLLRFALETFIIELFSKIVKGRSLYFFDYFFLNLVDYPYYSYIFLPLKKRLKLNEYKSMYRANSWIKKMVPFKMELNSSLKR